MSNPTTPFSWQMPTATDLVTDLPADFEVFGQAVATSMADLLGGTSGQILAKNSNTDMDFVWIANDQGDITGITASSPLTGGGTSGAVTVGIQDALTTQKGAVQLSDSTSSTSTTLAATANAVKQAYDLADAAIPKSLIDAAGDLIVGTAADTAGRIAIGTNGTVLTSNGTTATWAAASPPASASAEVTTGQGTTSTSYTDLATSGAAVTLTTGTKALVIISTTVSTTLIGYTGWASYAVSGATTIAAADKNSLSLRPSGTNGQNVIRASAAFMITNLTAGSNTFTMKYRTESGATANFENRQITVINMGS
jgi:hypothetical protein